MLAGRIRTTHYEASLGLTCEKYFGFMPSTAAPAVCAWAKESRPGEANQECLSGRATSKVIQKSHSRP
jgi:hypothetical protein